MGLLDYHENCKRVLSGDISLNQLVKSARLTCGAASAKITVKALAQQELKAFRQAAAAAVDRRLPASSDGTPASVLPINRELLHFVSVLTPNIRLGARAGSGKSTALIIKADFLINEIGLDPALIQMVTFNTAAADELAARLRTALGPDVGGRVRVNTFHSLAYHLVTAHPQTAKAKLLFDKSDDSAQNKTQDINRAVQAAVTAEDMAFLRAKFENSDYRWLTDRASFNSDLHGMLSSAALFFRTRREGLSTEQNKGIEAILSRICAHHEIRLEESNELDFEKAVRKAADLLTSPDSNFLNRSPVVSGLDGNTQFLMVDEFQDFSPAFQKLTAAIMARNPNCVLNAVGDDWQAINGFMGSDRKYFRNFRKDWTPALHLPLRANWRCGARIVALGNSVMGAEGEEAAVTARDHNGKIRLREEQIETDGRKSEDWQTKAAEFLMREVEMQTFRMRKAEERAGLQSGKIALIARKNKPYGINPGELVDAARREWPEATVEFITAHRSKGKEWDHVILLDASADEYPGKHPGNVLTTGIQSQADLDAEGQRLLYVAVTRAIHNLVILAPTGLHPRLEAARALSRLQ